MTKEAAEAKTGWAVWSVVFIIMESVMTTLGSRAFGPPGLLGGFVLGAFFTWLFVEIWVALRKPLARTALVVTCAMLTISFALGSAVVGELREAQLHTGGATRGNPWEQYSSATPAVAPTEGSVPPGQSSPLTGPTDWEAAQRQFLEQPENQFIRASEANYRAWEAGMQTFINQEAAAGRSPSDWELMVGGREEALRSNAAAP